MSDFRQQPNDQIHALNTRITTLVNNIKFQDHQTTETITIMLLQHAVKFHMARDWLWLQDQSQLTYKSLVQHYRTLEQCCEQYQKAQLKGHAELTTLFAATATSSLVHQDVITSSHTQCTKFRYKHLWDKYPATRQRMLQLSQNRTLHSLCRCLDKQKTTISGSTAGPTTETPTIANRTANLPADTDSPAIGTNSHTCRSPHPTRKHRRSPTPRSDQVSHITSTVHSRPEE